MRTPGYLLIVGILSAGIMIACCGVLVVAFMLAGASATRRSIEERYPDRPPARIEPPTRVESSATSWREELLTLGNFYKLRTGMTKGDAAEILSYGYETQAETEFGGVLTEVITWQEGTRVITATFQDGKLISKAQAGLR